MSGLLRTFRLTAGIFVIGTAGCAGSRVDLTKIHRPERPVQLNAYDVFVGNWNWTATMLDKDGRQHEWTGTAKWEWALDNRSLSGKLSSQSGDTKFNAIGVWSWHPKKKQYVWWMFNDWGYPQEGTAHFDGRKNRWTMGYKSVGLDGTTSHGRYVMEVIDQNTLTWRMDEWADPMHMIKKTEMTGRYSRAK